MVAIGFIGFNNNNYYYWSGTPVGALALLYIFYRMSRVQITVSFDQFFEFFSR